MKCVQIRSFSWSVLSRIRTEYRDANQSECGKIRTRKNSVFGHFPRSVSDIKTVDYQIKYCQTVDEQFQYSTKVACNSEKESYFLYTLLNNLQEKYQKLLVSVAGGISDRSKK